MEANNTPYGKDLSSSYTQSTARVSIKPCGLQPHDPHRGYKDTKFANQCLGHRILQHPIRTATCLANIYFHLHGISVRNSCNPILDGIDTFRWLSNIWTIVHRAMVSNCLIELHILISILHNHILQIWVAQRAIYVWPLCFLYWSENRFIFYI